MAGRYNLQGVEDAASEASSWSVHNILTPDWSEGSQGGVKMFPWLMIVMSQVLLTRRDVTTAATLIIWDNL